MAWQDRDYYRQSSGGIRNPLTWLLSGSVPLFRVFGIQVRAHAMLVVSLALMVAFGIPGFGWQANFQAASILFLIVLLHEFGHCFTARWVGGEADEIVMHPLGGLALARPPHRWRPTLLTVLGGPAVNVVICILSYAAIWAVSGSAMWNPAAWVPPATFLHVLPYLYFIYACSLALLLFNLLPFYPLDGGQIVQSILWWRLGYIRSMNISCLIGIVAAGLIFPVALFFGQFMLAVLAAFGIINCLQQRRMLKEAGPWMSEDEADYSASLRPESHPRRRHISSRAFKRARRRELAEREEQAQVDVILAKVSAHGLQSLTRRERRVLHKATERQRDMDLETSRPTGG